MLGAEGYARGTVTVTGACAEEEAGAQYHVVCTTCLVGSRGIKYCILQKIK